MEEIPKSAPYQLLKLVWDYAQGQKNHYGRISSYRKFNLNLQAALSLAIKSGMIFDKGDFEYIGSHFRFGYWGGNNGHMLGERYYTQAVWENNISACQSFEMWKKRKPFIFVDVSYRWDKGIQARSKIRLAIRSKFKWNREDVEVTSFSWDGSYLVACSYKDKKAYPTEVFHQYKLTPKDLRARMIEIKRQEEIKEKLGLNNKSKWPTFTMWVVDLFYLTFQKDQQDEQRFYGMFT